MHHFVRDCTLTWGPASAARTYLVRTTSGRDKLPNGSSEGLIQATAAPSTMATMPHNAEDLTSFDFFALQLELSKTTSPSTWPTAFSGATNKIQAWGASTPGALDRIVVANDAGTGQFGPYMTVSTSTAGQYHDASLAALGMFTASPVPNIVNVANVGVAMVQFFANVTPHAIGTKPYGAFAYLISLVPAEATPAGETHIFTCRVTECYGRLAR